MFELWSGCAMRGKECWALTFYALMVACGGPEAAPTPQEVRPPAAEQRAPEAVSAAVWEAAAPGAPGSEG